VHGVDPQLEVVGHHTVGVLVRNLPVDPGLPHVVNASPAVGTLRW